MLVAGEEAGVDMPFGCRMGVCHTCVARLREGTIRDLRTGDVREARNEMVRTCIHAAEGPVELDL
jgi:ferredoxin